MLLSGRLFILGLMLLGSFTTQASSQSPRRFPHSHITVAEWQTYLKEVKAKRGARDVSRADNPDILAIIVDPEYTFYYFTKSGPAHPAVVVEEIIKRDGAIYLQHYGYFAGSEEAFARWFGGFQKRTEAIREHMKARKQPVSP